MKDFRMGLAAAGLGLLTVTGGLALGCGSDGSTPEPSRDQHSQVPVGAEDRERIEMGLTLTPVPVNLNGLDRDLVGLGSYIVNAQSACNDCHTNTPYAVGGNPFLGEPEQVNAEHFLAGGMSFGPGVVSPNLTPNAQGLPAGLTYEAFLALMRTGREPSGAILQVMPWPIYGKMRDADLRAIYEYLRAIPPAQPGTAPAPAP
ncbi:cytochrome C [Pyxidicoccus trucidator]|uniref:cytochrome C n=1 Tax=Pyxidicoccus trucidator TaxID=2709662 RepID=UPI0013D9E886|nr:cytochrome C [Pyxidicoccus trucidator]